MANKLSTEIEMQILDEADKYGFVVPYNNSKSFYIEDRVKGYTAGATIYAKKWQAVEQRADRYEKALNWVKQYALNCRNNRTIPNLLVIYSTIDKALTPKPTTDDCDVV